MSDGQTDTIAEVRTQLGKLGDAWHRKYLRFFMSALSGIPWVGGFMSASASLHGEIDQGRVNDLQQQWLGEHARKLEELATTLQEITSRLEQIGGQTEERLNDPGFLSLVEQGFRIWNDAVTEEKRQLVRLLLTNAGGTKLCSDDVIRLFLDWIERYHEAHFAVIREVHKSPGATRADVWDVLHGGRVREDSADADLFKLLYRDLSTGGVIRQSRQTTGDGQFVKKRRTPRGSGVYMKSAFDDTDPYELTELGTQFVHYTMNELVPRLNQPSSPV